MKSVRTGLGLVLAASILVAGCSSAPTTDETVVDERGTPVGGGVGINGADVHGGRLDGSGGGGRQGVSPFDDPSNPLSKRVFYFEYDSAELRREDYPALEAHARFLTQNPQMPVVVEGHADERGSREYNLALGERRAQSIERLLSLQAVAKSQMQVISFGEERPIALGHDEESWYRNRRVELIYSGQ